MVSLITLRTIIGFTFNGFGIAWSLTDNLVCDFLCKGQCGVVQNNNCSLLLLFVGIIFIVCGYALIVMKDKQDIKLGIKLKKNFFSILKR